MTCPRCFERLPHWWRLAICPECYQKVTPLVASRETIDKIDSRILSLVRERIVNARDAMIHRGVETGFHPRRDAKREADVIDHYVHVLKGYTDAEHATRLAILLIEAGFATP